MINKIFSYKEPFILPVIKAISKNDLQVGDNYFQQALNMHIFYLREGVFNPYMLELYVAAIGCGCVEACVNLVSVLIKISETYSNGMFRAAYLSAIDYYINILEDIVPEYANFFQSYLMARGLGHAMELENMQMDMDEGVRELREACRRINYHSRQDMLEG